MGDSKRSHDPYISIILGSYNRLAKLQAAVASCKAAVGEKYAAYGYEVVVADGGSTDGTRRWLAEQGPEIVMVEGGLFGAVIAFNAAYAAAKGIYIATFNDDAVYEPYAIAKAVGLLERTPAIGQVALEFQENGTWLIHDLHGAPYANYGVIRGELANRIAKVTGGIWAKVYRTYGADCELSCWVRRAGFEVRGLFGARVVDLGEDDLLRQSNHDEGRARRDQKVFWGRWAHPRMCDPGGPRPHVGRDEWEIWVEGGGK